MQLQEKNGRKKRDSLTGEKEEQLMILVGNFMARIETKAKMYMSEEEKKVNIQKMRL